MNRSTDFVPFFRPSLGPEEEDAVLSVMRSGWLTTGKVAQEFEREFADFVGSARALAVSSATAGLHLALDAFGVVADSLVVMPSYTFAATAEVARYLGAHPVFVDIDEATYNMDCRQLESCLRSHRGVRAIIPVHFAGLPCDMDAIMEIAKEYDVPVIEDAAHCFPSELGGRSVGTLGHAGVYSFYATKPITTGEGGMIVTNSEDRARRMCVMRLHGIDKDVWNRYTSAPSAWDYQIVDAGYKYNLTDIAAAIGRVQLTKSRTFLADRRRIALRYLKAFADCDYLVLPRDSEAHAWHLFVIRLVGERLAISRDTFLERLREQGVGASVHFRPLHTMPYYRTKYGFRPEVFPVSLNNFLRSLSLPLYPALTDEEVDRVVETVKHVAESAYRPRVSPCS